MVMMMCGRNEKVSLSGGNGGNLHTHTHTHTHTPISVAEKIFKVSFREAMNDCSWSNFLCVKNTFLAIELGQLYRML